MDNFTQEMLKALTSGEDFSFEGTVKEIVRSQVDPSVNEAMRAKMTGVIGYPKSAQGPEG